MTAFSFHAPFINEANSLQNLIVHFDYFLPTSFSQWQDKQHGSVQLIEVMDANSNEPRSHLSAEELIQIRRLCWEFLETHQLFKQHNIIPLFG